MTTPTTTPGSLHAHLVAAAPGIARTVMSKAGMLQASHTVEALASAATGRGVVAVGCQHERFWRLAEPRYADLGLCPVVAAVPTSGPTVPRGTDAAFVPLTPQHPLSAEWFVLALGSRTNLVLCGRDRETVRRHGPPQGARTFDAVLSADPAVVHDAVLALAELDVYRAAPEALRMLEDHDGPPAARDGAPARDGLDRLLAAMLLGMDRQSAVDRARRDQRAAELVATRDRERRRIVERVHDGSLQHLLAAAQDLEELETGGDLRDLRRARQTLREGIARLRRDIADTFESAASGTAHARLDALRTRHGRRGGFDTSLHVDDFVLGLRDEDVLACVGELLLNAAKHARATHVHVALTRNARPDEIVVEVTDDGVGIGPRVLEAARRDGHLGLSLTRARVRDLGGSWALTTAPGQGVRVRATIPVAPRPVRPPA